MGGGPLTYLYSKMSRVRAQSLLRRAAAAQASAQAPLPGPSKINKNWHSGDEGPGALQWYGDTAPSPMMRLRRGRLIPSQWSLLPPAVVSFDLDKVPGAW